MALLAFLAAGCATATPRPEPTVWHRTPTPTVTAPQPVTPTPIPTSISPPIATPEPTPTKAPPIVLPTVEAAIVTAASADAMTWLTLAGVPEEWHDEFLAIGWCESRHNPSAVGDGGNSRGWLQLWQGWFSAAGYDLAQWSDPVVNASVGLYVRQVRGRFGGVGGWSCADRLGIG